MAKYYGGFDCRNDLSVFGGYYDASSEEGKKFMSGLPTEEEILLAVYDDGNYEGSAFVLFQKDGKLFEVNGGHCSCYGLEGQWTPEETTWEALAIRENYLAGNTELQEMIKNRG